MNDDKQKQAATPDCYTVDDPWSWDRIRAAFAATPAVGGEREALIDRIAVYLDDTPHGGGHSDAAGANCWELLEEAMQALRLAAPPDSPLRGVKPQAMAALNHYRQADEDGVMVIVSRQALDEVIAIVAASPPEQLAAENK